MNGSENGPYLKRTSNVHAQTQRKISCNICSHLFNFCFFSIHSSFCHLRTSGWRTRESHVKAGEDLSEWMYLHDERYEREYEGDTSYWNVGVLLTQIGEIKRVVPTRQI